LCNFIAREFTHSASTGGIVNKATKARGGGYNSTAESDRVSGECIASL